MFFFFKTKMGLKLKKYYNIYISFIRTELVVNDIYIYNIYTTTKIATTREKKKKQSFFNFFQMQFYSHTHLCVSCNNGFDAKDNNAQPVALVPA